MAKRIPSLNWLRVFEVAARTESFARAADRLAMSAPAVSQQIRALEDHLGSALFVRGAAGVTLTETGRSLLSVVGDAIDRVEAAASEIAQEKKQKLVIGVSLTLAAGWLSPRLPAFLALHPELSVEIHSLMGRPELPPREAELWIAFGPPPPGKTSALLFGERLFPVAHPDIAAQIEGAEDLLAHPIIEVLDHRQNWMQLLDRDYLSGRAQIVHVDTTFAALALAAAQGGLALARAPASDDLVEKFGLVPCLPNVSLAGVEAYHILHDATAVLTPGATAFRDWVLAQT